MNSRERVLKAINRQQGDRVPTYLWLVPALIDLLKKERAVVDHESYFHMDIRFVEYSAEQEHLDFTPYVTHYHPDTSVDGWGCGSYPVGYYHFTKAQCPLENAVSITDIMAYPFPQQIPQIDTIRKQVTDI